MQLKSEEALRKIKAQIATKQERARELEPRLDKVDTEESALKTECVLVI